MKRDDEVAEQWEIRRSLPNSGKSGGLPTVALNFFLGFIRDSTVSMPPLGIQEHTHNQTQVGQFMDQDRSLS